MKLRNRGTYDANAEYIPGDIVRKNGESLILSRSGEWKPCVAAADPALTPKDGTSFTWRGEWSRKASYEENDVVRHLGSAWICIAPTSSHEPGVLQTHWELFTVKGDDGEDAEPPEPIAFNFRGKWRRQQYNVNDVVTTDDDGSFVCIRPTKTEPPTPSWQALAMHGKLIEREFHSRVVIKKQSGDGTTAEPEKVTAVFNEDTPRGAPVCVSGSGGVDLASAVDKPGVLGLCSGSVVSGASSQWQPEGLISGDWSQVTESGNPTLTPGAIYYLSETPGKISETAPTSGYIVIVGRATDSGAKLAIEISVPVKL